MHRCTAILLTFVLAAMLATAADAGAHSWPSRPVRMFVPSGPGVPPDVVARLVSTPLSERIGQPIVVENRPGGTAAAVAVAEAPPDGHTIALAHTGFSIAPSVMARPGYDVGRSLAAIGRIATVSLILMAHESVPAKTLLELVELARAQPGGLDIVAPTGTLPHLAAYLLMASTGTKVSTVPYKTASLAYPDLRAGRVHLMFDTISPHRGAVAEGKVRALAVAGPERTPVLPAVPTTSEAGFPDLQVNAFFGLVGPAGLPDHVVTRLSRALDEVLASPDVQASLERQGLAPAPLRPRAFGRLLVDEAARFGQAMRAAGVAPQ